MMETHDIDQVFVRLRDGFYFRTLTPREFVVADLNKLADVGIFPEYDMYDVFRARAER